VDHLRQKASGEFDLQGKPLWQTPVLTALTAVRNGHVLTANWFERYVAESDRAGKTLWQYQLHGGYRPWRARMR
jgi:hypothetical protein